MKSNLKRPYYVEIILKRGYGGPPAANAGHEKVPFIIPAGVQPLKMIAKIDYKRPAIAQLGTILYRVDNKIGELKLIYALPTDRPNMSEPNDNYGKVVPEVAQSISDLGVPLFWN